MFLAFDLECAVGVLGEGQAADYRAFVIIGLAMDESAGANQPAVESRNLDLLVRWIDADVDKAVRVIDEERVRIELPFPTGGLQLLAVDENHVGVETV